MKHIIFITLALVMVFALVGCVSPKTAEPVNIAFVFGIADGETEINSGISELAALPAQPGTDYAFISLEGDPVCIGGPGTIPDFSDRGYTDVMMERVRAGIRADLADRLASYKPVSPEIDIAASIDLAVRNINANVVEGRKNYLILYCGGKSTKGIINMVETPVYKLDIEASVPAIAEKMSLDMSNIDEVVWYCCGCFGASQPTLSSTERTRLKTFYEQLFTALGAKKVTFKEDLPKAEYYCFEDTPVSCMAVEGTISGLKELVVFDHEVLESDNHGKAFEEPVALTIRFVPDKAEYLHPEEAIKVLQPIAEYLINHNITVVLAGTTAGDTDSEKTMTLSLQRAQCVKLSLVALGVDEAKIVAIGLGSTKDPWHIYGAGVGDGPQASQNRKVVICDIGSDTAAKILANRP